MNTKDNCNLSIYHNLATVVQKRSGTNRITVFAEY